ncbi:MAG: helix-turn-helix domain-containing protein [Actinomycetota bacterium]|nr:helix-turn-helix domain-containing protein [Actinomycetota bacterium]
MGDGPVGSFGEILRTHRLRARLTQQQLAERSGISVRALRYIERGTVGRPRPESVRKLAAAVGVPPEELAKTAARASSTATTLVPRLRIGLLGSFTVEHGTRLVEVGALKQRSLLALLALHANTPVRREEIVDVLWGDRPPDSCLALVHTYVSRLRRALVSVSRHHSGVISSVAGGYQLTLRPDQLDLLCFAAAAERADRLRAAEPAAAADLLDQALAYWRGPVMADLPIRLRQHPNAVGLAARRRDVALTQADLGLALGRYEQVVARLRPLAHDEPLHEGLHARLMLALAGTGEQAAALTAFTDIRVRLVEELGVEPGLEIRDAHLRVLRERPVPARPVPRVPAQLPTETPGFVGRAAALERLDELLAEIDDHAGVVVVAVSGSAGVGKTALAVRWAHQVRDRFPDGQFSVDLRGYAAGMPPTTHEILAQFLHALGVSADRVPTGVDEAGGLYRTLVTGKRMLVLLDNAATAEQVRPLLPGSPGTFVLVTSRDRLTGLTARDGAHPLPLDVLAPDEAVALLGELVGVGRTRREASAAAEMADTCAHLPLALRIAGANLAIRPLTSVADYTRELRDRGRMSGLAVAGDESGAVRVAFDLSYEKLVPAARRLFRLLGLVPGADISVADWRDARRVFAESGAPEEAHVRALLAVWAGAEHQV